MRQLVLSRPIGCSAPASTPDSRRVRCIQRMPATVPMPAITRRRHALFDVRMSSPNPAIVRQFEAGVPVESSDIPRAGAAWAAFFRIARATAPTCLTHAARNRALVGSARACLSGWPGTLHCPEDCEFDVCQD